MASMKLTLTRYDAEILSEPGITSTLRDYNLFLAMDILDPDAKEAASIARLLAHRLETIDKIFASSRSEGSTRCLPSQVH